MRRVRRGLVAGSAFAALVGFAPARAGAAFPGRDGVVAWSYNISIADPQAYRIIDTEVGIVTVSSRGGADHPLTACVDPTGQAPPPFAGLCPEPEDVAYSPDGDTLAWDVPTGSGTYQFRVMVGDSQARRAYTVGSNDFDPSFAPNGQRLVFVRRHGRGAQIVTSDLHGNRTHVLARVNDADPGNGGHPAPRFSPDGKRILFVRNGGIWVMNASGGAPNQIIPNALAPDWSPTGKQITFIGSKDHRVYVANADGTRRRKLLTRAVCNDPNYMAACTGSTFAVFSPNGKQVAFSDADQDGNLYIYTISSRGGKAHQIDFLMDAFYGAVTGMSWQSLR